MGLVGNSFRWDKSQKAELAFWKQGEKKYQHFCKQYWENELENYCGNFGLHDFKRKRVLEVGCGPKGMVHYIEAGEKVGVDPLVNEYKNLNILEDGDVKHVKGSGENLQFADSTFDVVICFNVLDHSKNPRALVTEMHRVLKTGGRLLFQSHCVTPVVKPIRFLLRYLDKPHPWHFTPREIRKMIEEVGFKENFVNINIFHWRAKTFVKHVIAKIIIRNYFAILVK